MESFSGLGAKIGTLMHYIGRTYEIGTRRVAMLRSLSIHHLRATQLANARPSGSR